MLHGFLGVWIRRKLGVGESSFDARISEQLDDAAECTIPPANGNASCVATPNPWHPERTRHVPLTASIDHSPR